MTAIFENLEVGQQVAQQTFELTRDSLVRYAGASGDFNPIHYRDDIAQAVGLPGVLAHGMLTMGLAVQPVVGWLADADADAEADAGANSAAAGQIVEYGVRFTRPVVVPASGVAAVTVTATVSVVEPETRRARIDLNTVFEDATVLGKAQVWVQF